MLDLMMLTRRFVARLPIYRATPYGMAPKSATTSLEVLVRAV